MKQQIQYKLKENTRIIELTDGRALLYRLPIKRVFPLKQQSVLCLNYALTMPDNVLKNTLQRDFPGSGAKEIGIKYEKLINGLLQSGFIEKCHSTDDTPLINRWRHVDRPPSLEEVSLQLTHTCNLKCHYCYNQFQPGRARFLSYELAVKAIDDLALSGGRILTLTGGEPALHPQIKKIITYAAGRGLGINLITNGTLFDNTLLNFLGSQPINSITIGTDTLAASQDKSSKGFTKSYATILRLIEKKLPLRISVYLDSLSYPPELDYFLSFLSKHMVPFSLTYNMELIKKGNIYIKKLAELLYRIYEKILKGKTPASGRFYDKDSEQKRLSKYCTIGSSLFITTDGNICFCPTLTNSEEEAFCFGNIKYESISDIWYSHTFSQKRKKTVCHKAGECQFLYLCGGGCRSNAYIGSSDSTGCDPVMFELCLLLEKNR